MYEDNTNETNPIEMRALTGIVYLAGTEQMELVLKYLD